MPSNVIHLPRPKAQQVSSGALGFYVRVGRNDHVELLHLLAAGERGIFGLVIDAHNIDRHRELITEARRRNLDVILDPKTQQMGFPHALSASLSALPWGLERHHNVTDFDGAEGQRRATQIVQFARTHGFTQILGPSHVLAGPNDPWLRRDITMMNWAADRIAESGGDIGLIYSLALPIKSLRQPSERQAVIGAIADANFDAIWLKTENFGDNATGEKAAAYIEGCRDFHELGIPIVGDYLGGLQGLGALAFGAIGGIAHGVTMQQNFTTAHWRQPRGPQSGSASWRVYVPQLDVLLKPPVAEKLLGSSQRIKANCGCRDTHCCPHGVRDMIDRPARHAIYQRAREVERLSAAPQNLRAAQFLDQNVRPVSDLVARVAATNGLDEALQKSLTKKQGEISRLRETFGHLATSASIGSVAAAPPRRDAGNG
jgi:hypothetical protein